MTPAPLPAACGNAEHCSTGNVSRRGNHRNLPKTCVCVVGVGFVGESLLKEFGTCYNAIGYDTSPTRIKELESTFADFENVRLTTNEADISSATTFLISVPTPLRPDRSVNFDCILSAVRTVLKYARTGSTIVLESSVSVGSTREILGPFKRKFNCGMSPERIDPGRSWPLVAKIPKVVSALTPKSLKVITQLYSKVFETVVPVSKPEVAEMTKLFENCYRMVNIAYANEIGDACRSHGIDPKEMIDAASTKPYGFEAFYPGLGVGGHCIPINPFYLFKNNKHLPVLERATTLMWNRPKKQAVRLHRHCLRNSGTLDESTRLPKILVVGVGFKPGQSVLSCSPGLSFAKALKDLGCSRLAFYDPLVDASEIGFMEQLDSSCWTASYIDDAFDAVAICNLQEGVEFSVTDNLCKTHVRSFV